MIPAWQLCATRAGWLLLSIVVCLALLTPAVGAQTPGATPSAPATAGPPQISAAASILVDLTDQRIIAEQRMHERLPMASLTKVMTAVVALQHGALTDEVTIEGRDLPGEASIGLKVGERFTLETLLYGMLMRSGNDAAAAVARSVGEKVAVARGTGRGNGLAVFLELMNEQATKLGMTNTRFVNAHGLDAPGHYSTAYDLALLTQYALANPTFVRMFEARSYPFRDAVWANTNRLLYQYDGIVGGKTGVEDSAGLCLIEVAQRGDRRLLTVVLNAPQWYDDARALLDYGFDQQGQAASPRLAFGPPAPATGPPALPLAITAATPSPAVTQRSAAASPTPTTALTATPTVTVQTTRLSYGAGAEVDLQSAAMVMAQAESGDWPLAAQVGLGALVLIVVLVVVFLLLRPLGLVPWLPAPRRTRQTGDATAPWRTYEISTRERRADGRPRAVASATSANGSGEAQAGAAEAPAPDELPLHPSQADMAEAAPAPVEPATRLSRTEEMALAHLAVAMRYVVEDRHHAAEDTFVKAVQAAPDFRFSRIPDFWEMRPEGFEALAVAYARCNRYSDARAVVAVGLIVHGHHAGLTELDAQLQAERRRPAGSAPRP